MGDNYRLSHFESAKWLNQCVDADTPALTPGPLTSRSSSPGKGNSSLDGITYGVHWNASSYPAWTGKQVPRSLSLEDSIAEVPPGMATSPIFRKHRSQDSLLKHKEYVPPFNIHHIAQMIGQIRSVFGFQHDAAINVFELLMSQLDSRSSRTSPHEALLSLHADYVSGTQANYRKWYFAAQMDQIDRKLMPKDEPPRRTSVNDMTFDFGEPDSVAAETPEEFYMVNNIQQGTYLEQSAETQHEEDDISLEEAEMIWEDFYSSITNERRLVELVIYLFCWTEANQVRFMPECLAFIVKCCLDYYRAYFPPFPQYNRAVENLPEYFFLEKIITPIYETYCEYNFTTSESGNFVRREGDHKSFIGYDDMNQLFWYKQGIEKIKIQHPEFKNNSEIPEYCEQFELIRLPPQDWLLALADVNWEPVFSKTYRESRGWLHSFTNFSRIWILHTSMFWFYTAFHTPSLYTIDSNNGTPSHPREFVRWSIMSLGGVFGPLITLVGLIGEVRFIPRDFAGAKPLMPRIALVTVMLLLLLVPAVCNLAFNEWTAEEVDLMPATVISGVLFSLATLNTLYLSFQPLNKIQGYSKNENTGTVSLKGMRRYLSNVLFTSSFPKRQTKDEVTSWIMCIIIFGAKFTESYFFLTLSVRDPLRELGFMDLTERCAGDKLLGTIFCKGYPRMILAAVIVTDMILFVLDTYLWYVIVNTAISVSIAFKGGTSIWTPWRNIYSQLSQRISTKLLSLRPCCHQESAHQRSYALRVVWNSIIDSMYRNHVLSREHALELVYVNETTKEPEFFATEEDSKVLTSLQGTTSACRRISFFAQSLSTPMKCSMPVAEMPSFTVLIPHYKETMIMKLGESIKLNADAKITVLEYLQKLHPNEWANFVAEKKEKAKFYEHALNENNISSTGGSPISSTSSTKFSHVSDKGRRIALEKLGFSSVDPNDTEPTRLWCSERTQTLFRTLKGFANYTNALRVFYHAEEPCGNLQQDRKLPVSPLAEKSTPSVPPTPSTYVADIEPELVELCNRKFRLLVAIQLYTQFTSEQLTDVETILGVIPELTISYVESEVETGTYFACMFDATCPLLDNGRRAPKMRIKLSGNPFLGDGKSDNQNTALPFYRGEYIQLVDANQDNYLEECLKIRNILLEFESGKSDLKPALDTSDIEATANMVPTHSILNPETTPIAIVGAREYIFSENIGILGDVAAGKEQTFGTLFSRTLARVGAKLHYGHPDFLNAIFMTTRGGVSKAQRGLHLNEDIYAGMTALLRGGKIKHTEYFQCGKGRDLGFVSILNFTTKIGAGMGEQILSREYFYMGTQLPFDRFITFYYAHPGFHLNNAFIMLSLETLLMTILWIASIASTNLAPFRDPKECAKDVKHQSGCTNILPLLYWVHRCVISIFLVFFVSLCPLFFQELTECGLFKSLTRAARHFCSLSMLFEVFACRIYARSFWEDMKIGGARYLATGRGFATSRIHFYKLYNHYHPEVICGLRASGGLLFSSIVLWDLSYLWFWVTTFSLCFSPFLYNPHQFSFIEFFVDYRRLLVWFWNTTSANDSSTSAGKNSWTSFTREARSKLTGVKKRSLISESVRPSFFNVIVSKVGSATLSVLSVGIPYVFISTQKVSRHEDTPQTNILLRVGVIAGIPLVLNAGMSLVLFIVSLILKVVRVPRFANFVAMTAHLVSLLGLIGSWWVLYVLEIHSFSHWLLSICVMCSVHHLLNTLLTVILVSRQRDRTKSNDPWWSGEWHNAKLGWQLPFAIAAEFVVKQVECLQFAYDFLVCHFLLAFQFPLLLVPYIDKLHSLFLMWLRPSITGGSRGPQSRRTVVISRQYCGVFIFNVAILTLLVTLPLYAPLDIVVEKFIV